MKNYFVIRWIQIRIKIHVQVWVPTCPEGAKPILIQRGNTVNRTLLVSGLETSPLLAQLADGLASVMSRSLRIITSIFKTDPSNMKHPLRIVAGCPYLKTSKYAPSNFVPSDENVIIPNFINFGGKFGSNIILLF